MNLLDDLPFPPASRDVRHAATANTVCVAFFVDGTIEDLSSHLEVGLADKGWTAEMLNASKKKFLNAVAVKGSRRLFVHAHRDNSSRAVECMFRVMDSSVEHCDLEAAANPTAEEAAQVLQNLRKTYRKAQSYCDRGEQHTSFITSASGDHEQRLRYTTAFVRPDRFRFEYAADNDRYIVYQSGDDIRTYWTLHDEEEEFHSLSRAVAGPAGVSGGTVGLAAALLGILRDYDVASEMRDAILLPDEIIHDTRCYVVHGYDRSCQPYTLWISKHEHLLLRKVESTLFADMKAITTTTIEAQLNTDIPDEALAYAKEGRLPTKLNE